jgi:hypothetical protein
MKVLYNVQNTKPIPRELNNFTNDLPFKMLPSTLEPVLIQVKQSIPRGITEGYIQVSYPYYKVENTVITKVGNADTWRELKEKWNTLQTLINANTRWRIGLLLQEDFLFDDYRTYETREEALERALDLKQAVYIYATRNIVVIEKLTLKSLFSDTLPDGF